MNYLNFAEALARETLTCDTLAFPIQYVIELMYSVSLQKFKKDLISFRLYYSTLFFYASKTDMF
jgi:hypothetical protein